MLRSAMLIVVTGVAVRPMAFIPFGSVMSSRKIGSLVTIEWPFPLWFSAGATIVTSPIACSTCASAARPGARTPSSLLTRIRYGGGGCRRCCAKVGASSHTPSSRARRTRATAEAAAAAAARRSAPAATRRAAGRGERGLSACRESNRNHDRQESGLRAQASGLGQARGAWPRDLVDTPAQEQKKDDRDQGGEQGEKARYQRTDQRHGDDNHDDRRQDDAEQRPTDRDDETEQTAEDKPEQQPERKGDEPDDGADRNQREGEDAGKTEGCEGEEAEEEESQHPTRQLRADAGRGS